MSPTACGPGAWLEAACVLATLNPAALALCLGPGTGDARGFWPRYVLVLGLLAAVGAPDLVGRVVGGAGIVGGAATGVAAGAAAIELDRLVLRLTARRHPRGRRGLPAADVSTVRLLPLLGATDPCGPLAARALALPGRGEHALALVAYLLVAVGEEVVFRGIALGWTLRLPMEARAPATAGVVALFALSHLPFGWRQVGAKVPLSVLATGAALASQGLLAPVIAHVVVNAAALREVRRAGASPWLAPGQWGVS